MNLQHQYTNSKGNFKLKPVYVALNICDVPCTTSNYKNIWYWEHTMTKNIFKGASHLARDGSF